MPAGSAKKEMPKRAQTQAITFPFQVTGTASIIKKFKTVKWISYIKKFYFQFYNSGFSLHLIKNQA